MKEAELEIPGVPRAKKRVRSGRTWRGKAIHYKEKEEAVAEQAVQIYWISAYGREPLAPGAVTISITAYFRPPKSWTTTKKLKAYGGDVPHIVKPDYDNISKFYTDALSGFAYKDDRLIVHGSCGKCYWPKDKVIIKIVYLEER